MVGLWDRDTWLEVLDVLRAHKVRTLLTAFGVFWGIVMLMVMLGFGNGLRVGVTRSMGGLAANTIYMWGRRTTLPYQGLDVGRSLRLTNEDIPAVEGTPGVALVCPRVQLGGHRSGNSVSRGDKAAPFQVMGDVPEIFDVRSKSLTRGRLINPLDIAHQRKVAVVGTAVVEELFEQGEDPIGNTITINQVPFEVVGVTKSELTGDRADREDATLHLPLTTFQKAFSYGNVIGYIAVLVDRDMDAGVVKERVLANLARQLRFDPKDTAAMGAWDSASEFAKMQGLFMGIQGFVWFVGVMTLLSGIVGVSNIMLISVKERTREIGLRRALGARPSTIVGMVLQESLILTSLAGMAGIAGGVALLEFIGAFVGQDNAMFSPPFVGFGTVLIATAILAISGALAGLLPARVALHHSTADAIRA